MASTVTVIGPPERVKATESVFGSATVPVKQLFAVPHWATLPGVGEAKVYDVDVEALTPEQRERLIDYGCERFGLARDEAERELERHGFPILADNTTFSSDRPSFL